MSIENIDLDLATETFYKVLFEKCPDIEKFFSDSHHQHEMFTGALSRIGDEKLDAEKLKDELKILGKIHRATGISKDHLIVGREAFEQALAAGG